ncbi:MAG: hypothetical protein KDD67_08200 [Ignavibacteriae bacterium]|nr:hypothetical protein [Ignavibacteriota bacterium]MCB9215975.1 hypothetical protein [Ignavibacteria bacterium]
MVRFLCSLLVCLLLSSLPNIFAQTYNDESGKEVILQRVSDDGGGSYPEGDSSYAPLATGYYITDNADPTITSPWRPSFEFIDTTVNPELWHRVSSGPGQEKSVQFPEAYFRNPSDVSDSTDNAIAGPIPIGFTFYYYGHPFDHFIVTTNGRIRLTTADGDTAGLFVEENSSLKGSRSGNDIFPLWDDLELSQSRPSSGTPDDFGRVYWSQRENELLITYYRISMPAKSLKKNPGGSERITLPSRVIHATYQVVLRGGDSSIQFNYADFSGEYSPLPESELLVPASHFFRANSTVGLRHVTEGRTEYLFSYPEGEGGESGSFNVSGGKSNRLHKGLAVKFSQWRNVGRIVDLYFQQPDPTDSTRYIGQYNPENFEMLVTPTGSTRIRPFAIIENVSSDRGRVNVTPQPQQFNVRFRIRNEVNPTLPPIFEQVLQTKLLYPTEGMPGEPNANRTRSNLDTLYFDPYIPTFFAESIGRFVVEVEATPVQGEDRWPFDNWFQSHLFVLYRQSLSYTWWSDYDLADQIPIPDVRQWVSRGATVVDGTAETWNPKVDPSPVGKLNLQAPVIKLDRRDLNGRFYNDNEIGVVGGDTLISAPINIPAIWAKLSPPYLLFSYQRGGAIEYHRGWSSSVRQGPESALYNVTKTGFYQIPDHLLLEFAEPSSDSLGVGNPLNSENWIEQGFLGSEGSISAATYWGETAAPRWAVFGGGGGMDTVGLIHVDSLDAGNDRFFKKVWVPIPSRFFEDSLAGKNFRFRFRVVAKNDGHPYGLPVDDEDAFYIDNVWVRTLDHPEVEITGIEVDLPYTEIPPSQGRAIPLRVQLYNNDAPWLGIPSVEVKIERLENGIPTGQIFYRDTIGKVGILKGETVIYEFPPWDATQYLQEDEVGEGKVVHYRISAELKPNFDYYFYNDNYTREVDIRFGSTLAYDGISLAGTSHNDIPNLRGIVGSGLNLSAQYPDKKGRFPFGSESGQGAMAIPFRLSEPDTIRGYQVWYGSSSSGLSFVQLQLYRVPPDSTQSNAKPIPLPNNPLFGFIEETRVGVRRGVGIPANELNRGEVFGVFDQYLIHPMGKPYVAEPGEYYVVITQLSNPSLNLGASVWRQGGKMILLNDEESGVQPLYERLSPEMQNVQVWYSNGTNYNEWFPMLSREGYTGFPLSDVVGTVNGIATYQQGSWMPMVRPRFTIEGYVFDTSSAVQEFSAVSGDQIPTLRVDPNPATERVRARFSIGDSQRLRLELCNLYGVPVRSTVLDHVKSGEVEWDIRGGDGGSLPSGLYLCRAIGEGVLLVRTVVIVE